MTMHRIILDTLWTIASEVLCFPRNPSESLHYSSSLNKGFCFHCDRPCFEVGGS